MASFVHRCTVPRAQYEDVKGLAAVLNLPQLITVYSRNGTIHSYNNDDNKNYRYLQGANGKDIMLNVSHKGIFSILVHLCEVLFE